MYNAREGLIAHLDTLKDGLGIAVVKQYAGEFEKAKEEQSVLLEAMPMVLATVKDGSLRKGHGHYECGLVVVSNTSALGLQDAATDAMQMTEALARDLEANFTWDHAGRDYCIVTDDAFHMQVIFIGQDFTVVGLTFEMTEL